MVIHKTMAMPTSCLSCWIAPTCEVWVKEKSKYNGYDNRLDECPLEEVVRCKDCKYYDGEYHYCDNDVWAIPNSYCHHGERREDADK